MASSGRLQRVVAGAAICLALTPLMACGSDEENRTPTLTAAERAQVVRTRQAIGAFCTQVGRFLARRRGPPTERELERATAEIDRLGAIVGQKPEARYDNLTTVRQAMGDMAESLEASDCSPALEARIEQALASGP
jgi:hypothetical protein